MNITISAPGKLHLLGEHSVVYGKPAIIAAVNKRCAVTIRHSGKLSAESASRISKQFQQTERFWTSQNDGFVKFCLNKAFSFFKESKSSWNGGHPSADGDFSQVDVESEIPLGSGMGSSAAVAVSISGAVSKLLTGKIIKEQINKIAFKCEKLIHGNPSGGDNTACTYGGLIWYQRKNQEDNNFKILQLPLVIPENISSKFFIINTGKPEETTKEMVEKIKDERLKIKDKFDNIFNDQENLVYALLRALKSSNEDNIKEIIIKGEHNLENLGVVSESTKNLIRKIEFNGGAAKICGSGGEKGASGIVLVFHNDVDEIDHIAKKFNLNCEKIRLGEEGVRLEKNESSSWQA